MTKTIAVVGMVTLLTFAAALPGLAAPDAGCDRAAAIEKHVKKNRDIMPPDVRNDLLRYASELCPDKGDKSRSSGKKSASLAKAEELLAQGKEAEALTYFQKTLGEEGHRVCQRLFEVGRELKKKDKQGLAREYFEAGLSACDDSAAQKELDKLAAKAPDTELEAKGSSDLISKQVIVESLSEDSGRRRSPRIYEGYWRHRDRRDRERWERRRCVDDEDAPKAIFPIRFHSGSARLTERAKEQLDILGDALRSRRLRRIRRFFIDGHTDSVGTPSNNCDLSDRRAEAVVRYLVDRWDIHPRRFIIRPFGEHCPLVPNDDSTGREINRRVELRNADRAYRDSDYAGGRCY
jgi:outer membrane protein OmpA-like peptidoglycan-associated protein